MLMSHRVSVATCRNEDKFCLVASRGEASGPSVLMPRDRCETEWGKRSVIQVISSGEAHLESLEIATNNGALALGAERKVRWMLGCEKREHYSRSLLDDFSSLLIGESWCE
jgi:hypothetical protein